MQQTLEPNPENPAPETARPFASPWVAAALLDCSKYTFLNHVEHGRLPLAFDIAIPGATRLCLRVATASVLAVRTGLKPSADMGRFFDAAFPKDTPIYRAARLAWILQCDYDHIYHLIGARALANVDRATRYQIPRESIVKFLGKRRLK
jgi:hypothetical protein